MKYSQENNRENKLSFYVLIVVIILLAYYPLMCAVAGPQLVSMQLANLNTSVTSYGGHVDFPEDGVIIGNEEQPGVSWAMWKVTPIPQTLFLTKSLGGTEAITATNASVLLQGLDLIAAQKADVTQIANCDVADTWSVWYGSGVLSADTTVKREGNASVRGTSSQYGDGWLSSQFNPAGTWDFSGKDNLYLWVRSDSDINQLWIAVQDGSGNWGRWWITINTVDTWMRLDLPFDRYDDHGARTYANPNSSATEPNLSAIDLISIGAHFSAANQSNHIWIDDIGVVKYADVQAQVRLNNVDIGNLLFQHGQNISYATMRVPFSLDLLEPINYVNITVNGYGHLKVESLSLAFSVNVYSPHPLWRSFITQIFMVFILEIVVVCYLAYRAHKWFSAQTTKVMMSIKLKVGETT
jgi:hypothetical protein